MRELWFLYRTAVLALNSQFLPVYEEVYHTLETQSLPHFLSYASTNVNQPKQMFW